MQSPRSCHTSFNEVHRLSSRAWSFAPWVTISFPVITDESKILTIRYWLVVLEESRFDHRQQNVHLDIIVRFTSKEYANLMLSSICYTAGISMLNTKARASGFRAGGSAQGKAPATSTVQCYFWLPCIIRREKARFATVIPKQQK